MRPVVPMLNDRARERSVLGRMPVRCANSFIVVRSFIVRTEYALGGVQVKKIMTWGENFNSLIFALPDKQQEAHGLLRMRCGRLRSRGDGAPDPRRHALYRQAATGRRYLAPARF